MESGGVKGTDKVVKEYDVVSYRPVNGKRGLENHHGVMNEWVKQNILGYKEKVIKSPTVAPSDRNNGGMHEATKKVYREWLRERIGRPVGAKLIGKMLILKGYKNYQKICLMLQRFRN